MKKVIGNETKLSLMFSGRDVNAQAELISVFSLDLPFLCRTMKTTH